MSNFPGSFTNRRAVTERLGQIGAQLKTARLRAGASQGEIGQRAGVPIELVNQIEAGHPQCDVAAVVAVAIALNYQILAQPPELPNAGEQAAHELIDYLRRPPPRDNRH